MKEFARAFYKSAKWMKCRKSYIDYRIMIDGGMCEVCGEKVGYIVHHKTKLTPQNINNPDICLNHDKLMYVCKDCHDMFDGHGLNKGTKPLCVFGKDGQPISVREIDISPYQKE